MKFKVSKEELLRNYPYGILPDFIELEGEPIDEKKFLDDAYELGRKHERDLIDHPLTIQQVKDFWDAFLKNE